ncbi:MAG: hypothetical protein RLZ12_115 [Bacillota bacterium]
MKKGVLKSIIAICGLGLLFGVGALMWQDVFFSFAGRKQLLQVKKPAVNAPVKISNYQRVFIPCYDSQNRLRIALRTYALQGVYHYLVVNPYNFKTVALPVTNFKPRKKVTGPAPGYCAQKELFRTPYMQALTKYTAGPYVMENYGLTASKRPQTGFFLTTDMCPSTKPFESEYFKTLVNLAERTKQPVPIGIAITGLWIIGHPTEFAWLMKQSADQKLQITWMNHSFSHVYYTDMPYEKNFLLAKQTNIQHEILATEKILLEHGQLPSVFFRFPGLISSEKLVKIIKEYGLIPVGSKAWLAKGQKPTVGSIILVHGNSNEPQGIKKVMPLLRDTKQKWLSLSKAF